MAIKMSEYVVRDTTGTVDIDATIEKFGTELQSYLDTAERESVDIGNAVHAVFDQHKGVNINMPALVSLSLQWLDVSPANYSDMSEKVADYVRSHKDAFLVSKGKGGGVRRIADIPPKP